MTPAPTVHVILQQQRRGKHRVELHRGTLQAELLVLDGAVGLGARHTRDLVLCKGGGKGGEGRWMRCVGVTEQGACTQVSALATSTRARGWHAGEDRAFPAVLHGALEDPRTVWRRATLTHTLLPSWPRRRCATLSVSRPSMLVPSTFSSCGSWGRRPGFNI